MNQKILRFADSLQFLFQYIVLVGDFLKKESLCIEKELKIIRAEEKKSLLTELQVNHYDQSLIPVSNFFHITLLRLTRIILLTDLNGENFFWEIVWVRSWRIGARSFPLLLFFCKHGNKSNEIKPTKPN